jgi:hypothetical protein
MRSGLTDYDIPQRLCGQYPEELARFQGRKRVGHGLLVSPTQTEHADHRQWPAVAVAAAFAHQSLFWCANAAGSRTNLPYRICLKRQIVGDHAALEGFHRVGARKLSKRPGLRA